MAKFDKAALLDKLRAKAQGLRDSVAIDLAAAEAQWKVWHEADIAAREADVVRAKDALALVRRAKFTEQNDGEYTSRNLSKHEAEEVYGFTFTSNWTQQTFYRPVPTKVMPQATAQKLEAIERAIAEVEMMVEPVVTLTSRNYLNLL